MKCWLSGAESSDSASDRTKQPRIPVCPQASLIWLASYPGDLLISFIYASVLAELGDTEMASKNLAKLLAYDPEFVEAASLLDRLTGESNRDTHANMLYLQRSASSAKSPTTWLEGLIAARNAWESGDLTGAEKAILESLAHNPRSPLPALFTCRSSTKAETPPARNPRGYLQQPLV
jgi:hypothetical protein